MIMNHEWFRGALQITVLVAVATAGVLLVAACSSGNGQSDTPENTGIIVETSGYWGGPSADEATRRADLIAIVTVDVPGPSFWTTLDGQRPALTEEGKLPVLPKEQLRWGPGNSPDIFTPWSFTVIETINGVAPESRNILYNLLGGTVGADAFIESGSDALFRTGDNIVLFLADCGPDRERTFGTPYVFVDRYVLDGAGNALAWAADQPIAYETLLSVIEEEKDNPPLAPQCR